MKKFIIILLSAVFFSCEGPVGPPGPPGLDGLIGNVFDVVVDFTPGNGYSNIITYPNNLEVFESDVVMVYLLEGQLNDPSGPVDIWTPLPATFFVDGGLQVVYNFNYTFFDVELFLDGNANLNNLGPGFTNNQVFRIAVLPAGFVETFNIDVSNYNEVENALKSQDVDFEILSL